MQLYKADKCFDNETGLIENEGGNGIGHINVADDWIFYSQGKEVKRMNFDGSEKQVLANIKTRDMVVEDEYIYYIDAEDWSLRRFRIKDKVIEKLSNESMGNGFFIL